MLGGMTETQRIWVERLREWKDSGKTLREFAEGQPYKAVTLAWWGSELRRRGLIDKTGSRRRRARTAAKTPAIRLARVVRRREPALIGTGDSGVVVEIGSARVVVGREFDAGVLGSVVRALMEAR